MCQHLFNIFVYSIFVVLFTMSTCIFHSTWLQINTVPSPFSSKFLWQSLQREIIQYCNLLVSILLQPLHLKQRVCILCFLFSLFFCFCYLLYWWWYWYFGRLGENNLAKTMQSYPLSALGQRECKSILFLYEMFL